MRKIFGIAVLMLFFSFVFVSAVGEEIRFYSPRSENLTIYEKCRIDGAICDNTFSCNLTVLNPEQSLIVDNEGMNQGPIYFNYTIDSSLTTTNGPHEATVDCTNSTFAGTNTFFFEITPNGSPSVTEGQGSILLASVAFLIIIVIFLAYLSLKSNNPPMRLGFLALSIIILVFTLGLVLNVLELSFGTFGEITNNFSALYILFTLLITMAGIALVVYLVIVAMNYYWSMRGMKDTFGANFDR